MSYLRGIFYSLPVQLLFLHFRKYQILLLFWVLLFSIASGSFMKSFGADALFLAPEYLGDVNLLSTALVGASLAAFIMCWNITTFILFSRHFTFLAATQFPFIKYCINNSVIPITFLVFYLVKAYQFAHYKELIGNVEIIFLTGGFLIGLFFVLSISIFYFFGADKSILRKLKPLFNNAKNIIAHLQPEQANTNSLIRSEWFLDSFFHIRRCRDVSHYSRELMDKIFKRHHFAAVISVLVAYLFLIIIGFFLDYKAFQIPAAASIILFCAVLIGVSGALTYFLQSWSVPVFILFLLVLNFLYQGHYIDPTNKAYGLNYSKNIERPKYTIENLQRFSSPQFIEQDRQNMKGILDKWKSKQDDEKPKMIIITTSGGGTRSATFTMNIMQRLDSLMAGQLMNKTFLITGASGGMIGASYFRELFREKLTKPSIHLQDQKYVDDISKDLLNPTFSSFVARDIFAPEQKFSVGPYTYLKDRGYSFERALNANTHGMLDKRLIDYQKDEASANIPLMFYHTVITRDGKKMLISTQPLRFMMVPRIDSSIIKVNNPDAIDYATFFADHSPYNLRILTALRMNATFPVVLPNVWLPTEPVIDVMDGGLRDNYGLENTMRFVTAMQDWLTENTSGVIMVQIRDRMDGGWENPYDTHSITDYATKPFFLLQHNWYKMMEYSQGDMLSYFTVNSKVPLQNVVFQYVPKKEENKAALSFHLSQTEKQDIAGSLQSKQNSESFKKLVQILNTSQPVQVMEK
jgi:hypothetical protein